MKTSKSFRLLVFSIVLNTSCTALVKADVQCTMYKHDTHVLSNVPCTTVSSVFCRDGKGHTFRSHTPAKGYYSDSEAACQKDNKDWHFTGPRNSTELSIIMGNADSWDYDIWFKQQPTPQGIKNAQTNLTNIYNLLNGCRQSIPAAMTNHKSVILDFSSTCDC